jgi:hypothetical protein
MILTSIWYLLETVALTALSNLYGQRYSLIDDTLGTSTLLYPLFCLGMVAQTPLIEHLQQSVRQLVLDHLPYDRLDPALVAASRACQRATSLSDSLTGFVGWCPKRYAKCFNPRSSARSPLSKSASLTFKP